MTRRVRQIDEAALHRASAVLRRSMPAADVRLAVATYVHEQRCAVLAQNPALALLTRLQIGESAPWPYRVLRLSKRPSVYLHGDMTENARELLGNSRARWRLETSAAGRTVTRVA